MSEVRAARKEHAPEYVWTWPPGGKRRRVWEHPPGDPVMFVKEHSIYEDRAPSKRAGFVALDCECSDCVARRARLVRERLLLAQRQQRKEVRQHAFREAERAKLQGTTACARCGCRANKPCAITLPGGTGTAFCVPAGVFGTDICSACSH